MTLTQQAFVIVAGAIGWFLACRWGLTLWQPLAASHRAGRGRR